MNAEQIRSLKIKTPASESAYGAFERGVATALDAVAKAIEQSTKKPVIAGKACRPAAHFPGGWDLVSDEGRFMFFPSTGCWVRFEDVPRRHPATFKNLEEAKTFIAANELKEPAHAD
jgi:hypothetical protein